MYGKNTIITLIKKKKKKKLLNYALRKWEDTHFMDIIFLMNGTICETA